MLLFYADFDKLRQRCDNPENPVLARPSPNAHTLALPRRTRRSPAVSVDRLKPSFDRGPAGAPPALSPARDSLDTVDRGRARGGAAAQPPPGARSRRRRVRRRGRTSADDDSSTSGRGRRN